MFMSSRDAAARQIQDGDRVESHNDVGSLQIQVAVTPAVRPGQVIVHHGWENYQFQDWHHFKSVMASPLNPIELAGGYYHIRPTIQNFYPGFSDRDTRVEVVKVVSD
jgi:anaerobic selenocysteine-containing dehydrogenase